MNRSRHQLTWTLVLSLVTSANSRTWTNINTIHPLAGSKNRILPVEQDSLFTGAVPTNAPSKFPTITPSQAPSKAPSITAYPTGSPTISPGPSQSPSSHPSWSPSQTPSEKPTPVPSTAEPTADPFPPNPPPSDPPLSYFNYDQNPSNPYGPGWPLLVPHNATTQKIEFQNNGWKNRFKVADDWYWHEFDDGPLSDPSNTYYGYLAFRNIAQWNFCTTVGQQSPIDVTPNGATCEEYHQIRPDRGLVGYDDVEFKIEPHLLRMIFPRRPCADDVESEGCTHPEPPGADLPHWWAGKADVIHIDFKIKSEHLLFGKQYDMEMQIFHFHHSKRRSPIMSIMVEATPSGHNDSYQNFLARFQQTFYNDLKACRRRRHLMVENDEELHEEMVDPDDYQHFEVFSSFFDDEKGPEQSYLVDAQQSKDEADRDLQSPVVVNPYHRDFVRTIYFLGYDGSITEPPCGTWASWRVLDTPMTVSYSQLFLTKNILFNHISPSCHKTSVHHNGSNARPIQEVFGRPIYQCTNAHYLSDVMKGQRPWSPHFI